MIKGYIYVITNDVNNKQYVGKTTDNLKKRFQEHLKDAVKMRCEKRPLYNAINKYGKEHFSIKLLEECEIVILSEREIYWINKLDTYHNGYNATYGGDGKQIYDYNLFLEDFKNGLTLRTIAKKYHCDINTISKVIKNAGLNTYENKFNSNIIAVQQKTLNNEIIQDFKSYTEAAKYIKNIQPTIKGSLHTIAASIRRAAIGITKTAYNYKWEKLK